MSLRVGSLVFAVDQGLGLLARAFHDHGIVTDVLVIRHGRRPEHDDWYPGAPRISNLRDPVQQRQIEEFCCSMDAMLFFETPFHWPAIDACRRAGVPTVLMPMHECMPDVLPTVPDLFLSPSLLDQQWASSYAARHCVKAGPATPYPFNTFFPVPVEVPCHQCEGTGETDLSDLTCGSSTQGLSREGREAQHRQTTRPCTACGGKPFAGPRWRQRERAEVFVHNAGHGGLLGRNGTALLLEAWQHVKSPARLTLRSQEPLFSPQTAKAFSRLWDNKPYPNLVAAWVGTAPCETLWDHGDVFIFPEKFNGLSLPLQEARAAGMLVMGTDRFPMNTWLPKEPLIPVAGTRRNRVSPRCVEFDEAIIEPRAIAAKIDEVFGSDISAYSAAGREWAEANSWAVLGPRYREVLEGLCG